MTEFAYWGDEMAITTYQTSSGTTLNIGALRGVEIIPSFQTTEVLYSADDVKFDTEAQGEFQVEVNVTAAKWDVATIQTWLGGSGTSSTSVVNTSDPTLFDITGEVTPKGSSTNLSADVTRCHTDSMPVFSAARNEFIENDITFIGQNLTVTGP